MAILPKEARSLILFMFIVIFLFIGMALDLKLGTYEDGKNGNVGSSFDEPGMGLFTVLLPALYIGCLLYFHIL